MSLFRRREAEPSVDIKRVPRESLPPFIRAALTGPQGEQYAQTGDVLNEGNATDPETPRDLTPRVDAQDLTFPELLEKINRAQRKVLEKVSDQHKDPRKKKKRFNLSGFIGRMDKRVKSEQGTKDQKDTDASRPEVPGEPGVIFIADTHPHIKLFSIDPSKLGTKRIPRPEPLADRRFGRYNYGTKG